MQANKSSRRPAAIPLLLAALVPALLAVTHPSRAAGRGDIAGVWQVIGPPATLHVDGGGAVPFTPAAKAAYDHNVSARRGGDTAFDTMARCLPPGIPRLLLQPMPFRITLGRRIVAQVFQWNHLYRLIYLDQDHFQTIAPAYLGNAVGRWDGTTLVVDSNQFHADTMLDDAVPHSDALHVVERIGTVANGSQLQDMVTIEDAKTFAHSFTITLRFRRLPPGTIIAEDYCLRRSGLLQAK